MHARSTVLILAVSFVCPLQFTAAQDIKPGSREPAAKAFIEMLAKGDFAKATETFDAAMLKALPAEELMKTWDKLIGDAGAFQKILSSKQEAKDKYDIVVAACEFGDKKIDATVVFDKDAKIAGLFFTPAKRPRPTGKEEIYEGKLKAGAMNIRLVFHFFLQKDGSYAGTMDTPDAGIKDIVLDEVTIKDDAVRLEFRQATIVYEGMRTKDGAEIDGTFKQAGQALALKLKRVTKVSEPNRPQHPKKPYPYDEVEVAYENKKQNIKLAGTLTTPKKGGPFPTVILITGSGPQDRDESIAGHKPFLVIADYLTRRGIAVLRVDDRGVGGSTGSTSQSTTADFAVDVLAGVEFLKGRKEIDAKRIGLIGHSEGGIIAPLVASQSEDIAFIVLLAGTGLPGDEVVYQQAAAILKQQAVKAEQMALQKVLQEKMFAVVRAEKDNAAAEKKLRAEIEALAASLGEEEKKQFDAVRPLVEAQIKVVTTPWYRFFLEHDPRPALRKVKCPVLALNGSKDLQVDAKLNLAAIATALKEADNRDVTTKELENLNHLFQTCKSGTLAEYAQIEETIAPAVLEMIATWIAERTEKKE